MINWKKNNKIALRNFHESVDFHDVVKLILVRMLRRKHPDSSNTAIYTEFNAEKPGEDFPDIWMSLHVPRGKKTPRKEIYVWEIQKSISKKWLKDINEQHEEVTLIIVDLKKIESEWENGSLDKLRKILEDYVV